MTCYECNAFAQWRKHVKCIRKRDTTLTLVKMLHVYDTSYNIIIPLPWIHLFYTQKHRALEKFNPWSEAKFRQIYIFLNHRYQITFFFTCCVYLTAGVLGPLCARVSAHDDVIKWKHFPRYWPFVRGIHRSRWIPRTKASDAEPWCFLWSAPE